MEGFRHHFGWPEYVRGKPDPAYVATQQGFITSFFALGCIMGSIPSGYLVDAYGRKGTLIGLTFIFTLGAVIQLVPVNIEMLYAGRLVGGVHYYYYYYYYDEEQWLFLSDW